MCFIRQLLTEKEQHNDDDGDNERRYNELKVDLNDISKCSKCSNLTLNTLRQCIEKIIIDSAKIIS